MDNIPMFLITVSIVGQYLYQIRKVLSLQMFPFQQNKRRAIRSSFGLSPREHVKSDYWNEVYHLGFKLSIVNRSVQFIDILADLCIIFLRWILAFCTALWKCCRPECIGSGICSASLYPYRSHR